MPDRKISALTDGVTPVADDLFVIARGADNFKLTWAEIVAAVGGGGSVSSVTRTITAAQLLNDLTAGIEITDAPAAGKIIVPLQVLARSNFGSKVYRPATVDIHVSSIAEYLGPNGGQYGILTRTGLLALPQDSMCLMTPSDDSSVMGMDGQALCLIANDLLNKGPIVTAVKNAGGSGYAPGDTGTIDGVDVPAGYAVDTVSSGAVATFHLTDPGADYAPGTGITTTPDSGGGSGFTVNITGVDHGDGTLTVTTFYALVDA